MYLLFDIGATKIRLAVSSDGKTFGGPKVISSPSETEELVKIFEQTARELLDAEMPEAICGGLTRKHLQAKGDLAKIFSSPSYFENDAALAGLGEARAGAGKDKNIVAYFTISTGVGGVRVTNSKIDKNFSGFEPGHQIININNDRKTLEQLISGRSLAEKFSKSPKEVTDPAVWDDLAKVLAYGLHNSIMHWSPEVVVLGGSMILGQPAISLDKTTEYLREISTVFPEVPELRRAELGDFNGLHGALHFLQQKLSNS